jgi:hypothetical protein
MEEDANEASARDHRAVIGVHTRASTHSCRDPRHAHGRGWLDELVAGNVTSVEQIAAREKCSMACQFDPGDLREQTRDGARNGFGEPRDREPKLAQASPQPAAQTAPANRSETAAPRHWRGSPACRDRRSRPHLGDLLCGDLLHPPPGRVLQPPLLLEPLVEIQWRSLRA